MEIDSHNLPSEVNLLQQIVLQLLQAVEDKDQLLARVQHQLAQLLRYRYGQKRERIDENQLLWYVVRYWKDIPGQEKRAHVRERICLVSGPGSLSRSERKRKAREIIQASGADSAEYFQQAVKPNPTGATFREQSEAWLQYSQKRKRNPIGQSYAVTIQGALDKWILPAIGDFPLGSVDNIAVKPLIDKMSTAGLSARTINKYVEFVQQIVASLKGTNGEPVHKRTWDAETMDLPVVEYSEQKQFMVRASVYPMGAKTRFQGLGITGFYDHGYQNNPPDTGALRVIRTATLVHFTTPNNGALVGAEYVLRFRFRNVVSGGNAAAI